MTGELSPILEAAFAHDVAEVERLLASSGVGDLWDAAAAGDLAAAERYLDAADPPLEKPGAGGFTPLHLAAYFGHAHVVGLLLDRGAHPDVVADDAARVRPLHSAVAGRCTACVRLLLAAGADPDVRQAGGFTALMAATRHGDEEIVRLLTRAGADPGIQADDGRTASDFAEEP